MAGFPPLLPLKNPYKYGVVFSLLVSALTKKKMLGRKRAKPEIPAEGATVALEKLQLVRYVTHRRHV